MAAAILFHVIPWFLLYSHPTPHYSRIKAERRSRLKAMEERAKKGVSLLIFTILSSVGLTYPFLVAKRRGESDSRFREG